MDGTTLAWVAVFIVVLGFIVHWMFKDKKADEAAERDINRPFGRTSPGRDDEL